MSVETGEFKHYHVYLDKLVSWNNNQRFFSFYYPGEAIIGLASHHRTSSHVSELACEKIDVKTYF